MRIRNTAIGLGLIFASGTIRSAEMVCLKTGSCFSAESHVQTERSFSVRIGSGSIDFPAEDVASIEVVSAPAAVPNLAASAPSLSGCDDPQILLGTAANKEGIDPEFVRSVAKIESDFHQEAISRKGALGLMQLMPSTATELGVDATQAEENAFGGVKYLRDLLIRYHGDSALTLAAYNAGAGAVQKFGGVPPYQETRSYILKVTREYDRRKLRSSQRDPVLRQ